MCYAQIFLMIWLTLGKSPLKTKRLMAVNLPKIIWMWKVMEYSLQIQTIFLGGEGFFCLNNFWKNALKKMADSSHVIIVWFNFFVGLTWKYLKGILLMFWCQKQSHLVPTYKLCFTSTLVLMWEVMSPFCCNAHYCLVQFFCWTDLEISERDTFNVLMPKTVTSSSNL